MTYGSLFSGAGGFDLGFDTVAECLFQVEIDATARDVLARHWPNVPKHTDVREVGKHNLPSVDVLIGGFPCQDLSVAGNRKGLQGGTRSGLFYELARIACELRPRFLVWENVPGLLSSDDGRDFARVLRYLGDNGFCGGWRVLDAEGFGVAQHRRRVFGVFSRGRAGTDCCAEILALRESLSRHPAESGGERADVAGTLGGGTAGRGWSDDIERAGAFIPSTAYCLPATTGRNDEGNAWNTTYIPQVAGTLNGNGKAAGSATQQDAENGLLVAFGGNDTSGPRTVAASLQKGGRIDFESETFIVNGANSNATASHARQSPVARCIDSTGGGGTGNQGGTICVTGHRTHALTHEGADASEDGTGRGTPIVAVNTGQGYWKESHAAGTLGTEARAVHETNLVAFTSKDYGQDAGSISPTLRAMGHDASHANGGGQIAIAQCHGSNVGPMGALSVRRLTPRECERLMGWPDDWTRYRANGKEIADGPRYRLCGNGVVSHVAAWIARRLKQASAQ